MLTETDIDLNIGAVGFDLNDFNKWTLMEPKVYFVYFYLIPGCMKAARLSRIQLQGHMQMKFKYIKSKVLFLVWV